MHSHITSDPIFGVEMTSITTVTPRSVVDAASGGATPVCHHSAHDGRQRRAMFPTGAIEADIMAMSPETEIDSNKTTAPITPAAATPLERLAPMLRPPTPPPLKPLHQHQHLPPNHHHGSIETLEGAHVFVCEGRWLKGAHQPTSPVSDNVEDCGYPHRDTGGVSLVSLYFDGDEALRVAPPFQHDHHHGPLPQYGGHPLHYVPFSEIVDVRRLSSTSIKNDTTPPQLHQLASETSHSTYMTPGEDENEDDPIAKKFFNGAVTYCYQAMRDTELCNNGAQYLSHVPSQFTHLHTIEVYLQQPHASPTRRQSMSLQDFCNLKLGEAAAEEDFPSSQGGSLRDDMGTHTHPQYAPDRPPPPQHDTEGLTLSGRHSRFSGLSSPTTSSNPCGLAASSSFVFATSSCGVADSLAEFLHEVATSNPTRCLLPTM